MPFKTKFSDNGYCLKQTLHFSMKIIPLSPLPVALLLPSFDVKVLILELDKRKRKKSFWNLEQ